ncbi:cupin domain-containing protein [Clavibacter sp. Sh2141]|uniref:cupin domain-containing protein n=1 Tax=Clavibacter sp. Sh2141 TaxID=3395374 RepID=UPI0039BC8F49
MRPLPQVRHVSAVPDVVWDDERGAISFRTLIGDGGTPTDTLSSGIALLRPGGWLAPHRHAAAEVYQVLAGVGIVTLDGEEHHVREGSGVFIPSDHEHGIRNAGDGDLAFVYVYATDSIQDVEYRWSDAS